MRFTRSHVVVLIAAGVLALGGCSSSADAGGQESPPAPASSAAVSEAADPGDAGQGDTTAVDSEFGLLSEVLVGSLNPEPTVAFTGEESVEYTFPSGSHTDDAAFSNCQIALGALGMDADVTVTYPDGSVRCADLIN